MSLTGKFQIVSDILKKALQMKKRGKSFFIPDFPPPVMPSQISKDQLTIQT